MNDVSNKHAQMVKDLSKPGEDILRSLTDTKCHLLHMAILAAEEAGEVLGVIKKHVIYNKPLDFHKLMEELGDLEFALEGIRGVVGFSKEEILSNNINKLLTGQNARYSSGRYSDEQAHSRVDMK